MLELVKMSKQVAKKVKEDINFECEVYKAISSFFGNDWGVPTSDEIENNNIMKKERYGRLFARYDTDYGYILIVKEYPCLQEWKPVVMFEKEYE